MPRKENFSVKRKRPKLKTLDKVLILVGCFIACFIIANLVIFCVKGSVPDTLIQCTLGAGGMEALMTTVITVTKEVRKIKRGKDLDDVEV